MSKKTKNYADLEKVRVFHNPKTDLIEITGKYVDGGNFSVTLPKGTKSDTKVRAEISTKESLLENTPQRTLPSQAVVNYDKDFRADLVRDGDLWHARNNKNEVFYLPNFENKLPSLFPVGVDMNRKPVLVDLHGSVNEKRNVFITAAPGRGGQMTLMNLAVHVLSSMPETDIITNSRNTYRFLLNTEFNRTKKIKYSKELEMLDTLRDIYQQMKESRHGVARVSKLFVFNEFEQFVHQEIEDGPTARTNKAVRAETMDLILEISRINRPEFNVNFVFYSDYTSDSMNAFLDTCHTKINFGNHWGSPAKASHTVKVFGRDLEELRQAQPGDGFIKDENTYKDGEFFASFINPAVMKAFQG